MFQVTQRVNGKILWANLFFLFCLSLIPFTTGWMGENEFDQIPVAFYGINLLFCAISYAILENLVVKSEGKESAMASPIKSGRKEKISLLLYFSGIVLAFFVPMISIAIYTIAAIFWLIPDDRIEKSLE